MPIDFACKCGRQFRVKDEMAGRAAKCPKCSRVLVVPAAPFPPAPAPSSFNEGQASYPAAATGYGAGPEYPQPPAQQQWQAPPAGYAPSNGYAPSPGYAPPGYAGGYAPSAGRFGPNNAADFHHKSLFVILGVIHSENAIKPQPNVVVLTPDDIIIPIVRFHNALDDYGVSMGEHAIPT